MKKNLRKRILVYILLLVLGVIAVMFRQQQVIAARNKKIISNIQQYTENGIPITVFKAFSQDVNVFSLLTVLLSDGNKGYAYISKAQKASFKAGQKLYLSKEEAEFAGKIIYVSDVIDIKTGMYKVGVEFTAAQELTNNTRIIYVKVNTLENVISVPLDILDIQGDQFYLWMVENGKAKRQKVEIASRDGYGAIIKEGLDSGQEVVLSGQSLLRTGSQVNVISAK